MPLKFKPKTARVIVYYLVFVARMRTKPFIKSQPIFLKFQENQSLTIQFINALYNNVSGVRCVFLSAHISVLPAKNYWFFDWFSRQCQRIVFFVTNQWLYYRWLSLKSQSIHVNKSITNGISCVLSSKILLSEKWLGRQKKIRK